MSKTEIRTDDKSAINEGAPKEVAKPVCPYCGQVHIFPGYQCNCEQAKLERAIERSRENIEEAFGEVSASRHLKPCSEEQKALLKYLALAVLLGEIDSATVNICYGTRAKIAMDKSGNCAITRREIKEIDLRG